MLLGSEQPKHKKWKKFDKKFDKKLKGLATDAVKLVTRLHAGKTPRASVNPQRVAC
jgi:hypothetical protein